MRDRPIKYEMTPLTHNADTGMTLAQADAKMREHDIRHLPVLDGDKLVGVISQRDLHLVESLEGVDPDVVLVGRAMTPLPYAVPPEEPLGNVVRVMAKNRYGCALVAEDGVVRVTGRRSTDRHACRIRSIASTSIPTIAEGLIAAHAAPPAPPPRRGTAGTASLSGAGSEPGAPSAPR